MPRTGKGRGGARQGAPGVAYANRSDLNAPKPVPVQTATGQQYGMATAQRQAQQAVPLAAPPPPAPSPPTAAGPGAPSPAPGPAAFLTPDDAPNLSDPTARPNEHVLSGAPVGPGAGPTPPVVATYTNARDYLTSALQAGPAAAGNSEVAYLLAQIQARGL